MIRSLIKLIRKLFRSPYAIHIDDEYVTHFYMDESGNKYQ